MYLFRVLHYIATWNPKGKWPKRCEHCRSFWGLKLEDGRTMYEWNGKGEDPNRSQLLCRMCAVMHHDYWDEMWADYYSGRL